MRLALAFACALALSWPVVARQEGVEPRIATPIIAEILGAPAEFVGRRVAIYGLVVEAQGEGRRFLLQDVSQMPLVVTAPAGESVGAGAQLMVTGTVLKTATGLELAADELLPVRVVAGGGCC